MSDIVYVGAVGRSGTTLLERSLATSPHVIALGEMVHLWARGARGNEPCGCGEPFDRCSFWVAVGERAFGGWDRVDLDEVDRDRRLIDRNRRIPWLMAPRVASSSFREARARLVDVLDRLYTGIEAVAGEQHGHVVLVDSSKHPSYLFLLRSLPSHRVRLLHVVRDPRGVAHSWAKHVARPESGEAMERLGTARAVARWTSHNLLFQLCGATGTPRARMNYERFTDRPDTLFDRARQLCADTAVHIDAARDDHVVDLLLDHTVSGNPMRFRTGPTTIRSDQAWQTEMPRARRWVVSIATTPLRQLWSR